MRPFARDLRRRRCTRLLVVLLLLASGVALRTAHWIATPHRLCEVHGTLEHGSVEVERGSASVGPVVRAEGRSHAECKIGPCARVDLFPLLVEAEPGVALLRAAAARWLPQLPLLDSERYRLAPSRSPPA